MTSKKPDGNPREMLAHWAYALTFFTLAATGALLFSPDLRLMLTSGYSLILSRTHRYTGIAAVPVLGIYGYALLTRGNDSTLWQKVHIKIVAVTGALFALSGSALWFSRLLPDALPDAMNDTSSMLHDTLSALALIVVGLHLMSLISHRGASGR